MGRKPKVIERVRSLRQANVPAEDRLWQVLRNRALGGVKFRRQHPIGEYVVDFACIACMVAVEADGETHLGRRTEDEVRAQEIRDQGWHLLRFWNTEIYEELESVKEAIYRACVERAKTPSP